MSLGLVVNAGSSSVKVAVLAGDGTRVFTGAVSEIGGASVLRAGAVSRPVGTPDHSSAVAALLAEMTAAGVAPGELAFAAHRVVHGGATLIAPARLTEAVIAEIVAAVPLAPLHNPANLAGIRAVSAAMPALLQSASFDTAFHATIPDVRRAYALPPDIAARGIRRYGFHGTSYAALVRRLPEISGAALPRRLLACHLGNGASLCAILDGRSVATTMGYSPVSGLVMGTRSGDIDANAVLRLAEEDGIAATRAMLNHRAGLVALGGASDMRALQAAGANDAIAAFVDSVALHAGAMIAAMGGLDAVAYTGGIGENAREIRGAIMERLGWAGLRGAAAAAGPALHAAGSAVTAWVVPADEEAQIALDARVVLRAGLA